MTDLAQLPPLSSTLPDQLEHDWLHVFLAGPGVGESAILRLPNQDWLVIDCWQQGRSNLPFKAVLERYQVQHLRLVVLTHPHLDHYKGMIELLDLCPAQALAFVGAPRGHNCPVLPSVPDLCRNDGKLALDLGGAQATFLRFSDAIEAGVESISLEQDCILLEDAALNLKMICLSPTRNRLQRLYQRDDWSQNYLRQANQFSSVLQIDWHGCKLLLGGDLPTAAWDDLDLDLAGHSVCKVPHHGSKNSISQVWTGRSSDLGRIWLSTPYRPSGLPRLEDGEGLDLLLRGEASLLLSGRPDQVSGQRATREQLQTQPLPNPNPQLFAMVWDDPPKAEVESCLVGASFDSQGNCRRRCCLAGAVEIYRQKLS